MYVDFSFFDMTQMFVSFNTCAVIDILKKKLIDYMSQVSIHNIPKFLVE